MIPAPLLRANQISKTFGRTNVLVNAHFSVNAGEILGLIGPNGAGKTTLFEILAGLLEADSSEVSFNGQPLAPQERKRALFYLPDAIRPWPDQTVRWALRFFEATGIAEALQLRSLMGSRIASLSKGELKRLLLAIALNAPQPLLLLDEPFDGLDFRQTREVMKLLRAHSAEGKTFFLSIHQLTDASRICGRFVLLSAGRVAGEGTLEELRTQAGVAQGGLEEVFLALT